MVLHRTGHQEQEQGFTNSEYAIHLLAYVVSVNEFHMSTERVNWPGLG